jgi:uncharacterized protein (TIGR02145 family)
MRVVSTYQLLILGMILLFAGNCTTSETDHNKNETSHFTDPRDGKIYKTVKIGDQWIMAENMAYKPNEGNYWSYDNDTGNIAKYGYLYDWETANRIAPEGWHLPSKKEWITLRKTLGGKFETWNFMAKVYPQLVDGGASGFNALLGGIRSCDGKFLYPGQQTIFWSSTKTNNGISIYGLKGHTDKKGGLAWRNDYQGDCNGYSVRLFKD